MTPDIIDGKYRVIREVGSGGMAHVYRAINMSSRKVVAVKMLKEEYLNDKEFLRRFDREARASLELSHDNIVRAYGVGEDNGVPYIVLEYVEGKTLKDLIRESPGGHLSVQQSIGICSQMPGPGEAGRLRHRPGGHRQHRDLLRQERHRLRSLHCPRAG